jgi:hypothetical protein
MASFAKLNNRCRKILDVTLLPHTHEGRLAWKKVMRSPAPFFVPGIKSFLAKAWGTIYRPVAFSTISLCVLGAGLEKAAAQAQVTGQWVTLPYLMPINPIRLDLLRPTPTQPWRLLIVAGSENDPNKHLQGSSKAAVWDFDLAAQKFTIIPMLWDVFCNGGTFFADGRCMVVGGTVEYDPFYGDPRITVFDPLTNKFNQLHSMAHGAGTLPP